MNDKPTKYTKIGKYIKRMREEKGMTQEDLATKIGVKAATLSLYESGGRNPDLDKLELVAKHLGVPLATILDVEMPDADLDLALRSEKLEEEDIKQVRSYIKALKYARRLQKETK